MARIFFFESIFPFIEFSERSNAKKLNRRLAGFSYCYKMETFCPGKRLSLLMRRLKSACFVGKYSPINSIHINKIFDLEFIEISESKSAF